MEEEEEEYYDDCISVKGVPDHTTHPSEEERNLSIRNHSQDQLTADGQTPDTVSTRKWQPLLPEKSANQKRQQQDKLQTTGSPEVHDSKQIPSTPGYYYYDGETFAAAALPDGHVYAPGSDYCHVRAGKDTDDDTEDDNDISESSSNSRIKSKGDVRIKSKLSGLTTLNIHIQLNVADLVQSSLSGRHRHNRTQIKKVQRSKSPDYEIPEIHNNSQLNDTSQEKEAVENNIQEPEKTPPLPQKSKKPTESILNEPIQVPSRPPRKTNSQKATSPKNEAVTKLDVGGNDKDDEIHENVSPLFGADPAPEASDNRSINTRTQNAVKKLVEANDWCVIYTERDQTETRLADGESQDGSFAVICENVEENPHYPFTLLLKYKGKVVRTPIRQIQEYRKTKYELLSIKKDSLEKLINHFRKKPLPDFKIKLRTMQYGSAVKL